MGSGKGIATAAEHAHHVAVRPLVVFFKGLRELREIAHPVADLQVVVNKGADLFFAAFAVRAVKADEISRAGYAGVIIRSSRPPDLFVGDGALLCEQELGFPAAPPLVRFQNAASVAFAALNGFDEEKLIEPQKLLPVYLRLPQAERELRAKKNASN